MNNLKAEVMKVLEIKPDHKYIIFFDKKSGVTPSDIDQINKDEFPELHDLSFLVEDLDGVKILELLKKEGAVELK